MPTAELHPTLPGVMEIHTNYSDRVLIKELPGVEFDGNGIWLAPLSWGHCVSLRLLFQNSLTVGDLLKAWATTERAERIDPCNSLRYLTELDPEDSSEAAKIIKSWRTEENKLLDFQEVDVMFMHTAINGLNGHIMGAGKTVTTIATMRLKEALGIQAFPALIITPASVKVSWQRHFEKWFPRELDIRVVKGPVNKRRKQLEPGADVYIINWEQLRLHTSLAQYGPYSRTDDEKQEKELNAIPFQTVVADEGHRAKNPKSKQTRGLWTMADQAAFTYVLTGTPISNHVDEFWSILRAIDAKEWPGKTKYLNLWTQIAFNFRGGIEDVQLREERKPQFFSIVDPRMRRLPKTVIMPHLPPLSMLQRDVEMSPKQTKAYLQMEAHMSSELGDLVLTEDNFMHRAMRLMQFASSHAEMEITGEDEYGELKYQVHLIEPSNKIDELLTVMEECEDEPIAVFAPSRQLIEMASRRLVKLDIPHGLVTGKVSEFRRQESIDDFQEGKTQLILCTSGAGGTGITLTAAPVLVRLQRSWRQDENEQTVGRVHRHGSEVHEHVRVIDLVSPDTVEDRQLEVLAGKFGNMQSICRDQETMRYILTGKK